MPTKQQIDDEWRLLKQMKKSIPHRDDHRLDNHAAIDAMIQILRFDLELTTWEDLDTRSAAEDAKYWMDGGEILSPAESWRYAVKETL